MSSTFNLFRTANCSVVPADTPSDAGIAGTGVLLSFTITAGVALTLSASLILQEFIERRRNIKLLKPHVVRRRLLNGYSDQQILTGIGIQSVGLAQVGTMVPYHFFVIWMLSLLSMATHNATLLALVHDFRRDRVLRWMRQFLMFINLVLSCVYGIYFLQGATKSLEPTLPIACVWELPGNGGTKDALSYIGPAAVIAGNCLVFAAATWYLHDRSQKFYRATQMVGLGLMVAFAIGAAVRVMLLSQAFGQPSVQLRDEGEKQWSFGQLVSMLLLILPVISVLEIYRGELLVAAPAVDEKDKTRLLDEGTPYQTDRHSFQPN